MKIKELFEQEYFARFTFIIRSQILGPSHLLSLYDGDDDIEQELKSKVGEQPNLITDEDVTQIKELLSRYGQVEITDRVTKENERFVRCSVTISTAEKVPEKVDHPEWYWMEDDERWVIFLQKKILDSFGDRQKHFRVIGSV